MIFSVENMDRLKEAIEQWTIDRNLHTADPTRQMLKLGEEYGELCAGMARNDMEKVKDSLGDMFVVMTVLSLQMDIDIQECVRGAYDEIKDRKGRMINGVFVKESDLKEGSGE
ncbi:MazG nucleotide pyrophosphohydrolase domain protein [compost metagenome]